MTDAPKRIYIRPHRIKASELGQDGQWTDAQTYDLARPGQPCSTDEFLERLHESDHSIYWRDQSMKLWVSGDFTAAMEGLQ